MTGLRRALLMIGATAFVAGLITIPLSVSTHHTHPRGIFLASQLVIGWSFVGTGLFMWWRRPENRLGLYMTAVGFTWLLGSLLATNDGYIFLVGELCAALPYGFLVQMLLSFPDGRLHSRLEQAVATATWFDVTVMQWLPLPFLQFSHAPQCNECPSNPLLVSDHMSLVHAIDKAQAMIAIVIVVGLIVALVRRWRALPGPQRPALSPVIWTGALARRADGRPRRQAQRRPDAGRHNRLSGRVDPTGSRSVGVPRRADAVAIQSRCRSQRPRRAPQRGSAAASGIA